MNLKRESDDIIGGEGNGYYIHSLKKKFVKDILKSAVTASLSPVGQHGSVSMW
jgi:hypothetical protein